MTNFAVESRRDDGVEEFIVSPDSARRPGSKAVSLVISQNLQSIFMTPDGGMVMVDRPSAARQPIMRKSILIPGLVLLAGNTLAANIQIGPNGCDLASAIRSANDDSSVVNCASGSGYDHIIAPDDWVVPLDSTLPTITSDLTIRPASAAGLFHIEGDSEHRVMKITGDDTEVTLQRVKISGGYADPYEPPFIYGGSPSNGPAIWIVDATVNLQDSIIIGNGRTRSSSRIFRRT